MPFRLTILFTCLSLSGCALSPHWVSLRQRERLYNAQLTRIHPGQTRANLNRVFPPIKPHQPLVTGRLKSPGPLFNPEAHKIDSDFVLYVTYRYKTYRHVPEPKISLPPGAHIIGLVRQFPLGTRYYRIQPRPDDLILAISPRVTASDSDLIYPPN